MQKEAPIRILQIGNGNFLRGFVDWMIQKANDKKVWLGKIHTVQIHSNRSDPRMLRQNNRFHVWTAGIESGRKVDHLQEITCVAKYDCVTEDYQAFLEIGKNPDLEFVISNTTEAGIISEEEDFQKGRIPKTFPGKMTALLWARYGYFKGNMEKGLIFLPCELIENNGKKLFEAITFYAKHWELGQEFIQWLNQACTFCNTLVDRIVPGFPSEENESLSKRLSYPDELLVMAEPFHFWAIEDNGKVQQALPLHQAGLNVKFVSAIQPYRERKVRILNGAHSCLVPFAYLQGLRTVRQSVEHPEVGRWLRELIFEEIIPTIYLDEEELARFAEDVLERFANPFIHHQLESIALNQISKFKVRVLPTMISFFEQSGKWPEKLTEALAATILFYRGEWNGIGIPLKDTPEVLAFFESAWQIDSDEERIHYILSEKKIWGQNLLEWDGLKDQLINQTKKLRSLLSLL